MMLKIRNNCAIRMEAVESVTLRPDGTAAICMASGQVQICAAEYLADIEEYVSSQMVNGMLGEVPDDDAA